jgi:hypothetical protein
MNNKLNPAVILSRGSKVKKVIFCIKCKFLKFNLPKHDLIKATYKTNPTIPNSDSICKKELCVVPEETPYFKVK